MELVKVNQDRWDELESIKINEQSPQMFLRLGPRVPLGQSLRCAAHSCLPNLCGRLGKPATLHWAQVQVQPITQLR